MIISLLFFEIPLNRTEIMSILAMLAVYMVGGCVGQLSKVGGGGGGTASLGKIFEIKNK